MGDGWALTEVEAELFFAVLDRDDDKVDEILDEATPKELGDLLAAVSSFVHRIEQRMTLS